MTRLSPSSQIIYICLFFFLAFLSKHSGISSFLSLKLGPVASCLLTVFHFYSKNATLEDKRQAHRLLQKSLSLW